MEKLEVHLANELSSKGTFPDFIETYLFEYAHNLPWSSEVCLYSEAWIKDCDSFLSLGKEFFHMGETTVVGQCTLGACPDTTTTHDAPLLDNPEAFFSYLDCLCRADLNAVGTTAALTVVDINVIGILFCIKRYGCHYSL
jgi:hypothetical protein